MDCGEKAGERVAHQEQIVAICALSHVEHSDEGDNNGPDWDHSTKNEIFNSHAVPSSEIPAAIPPRIPTHMEMKHCQQQLHHSKPKK
mmetsp:Transcript_4711/g.6206  ORF Transcript_4711/g.6206 Transcript_4711/m.6206 type:complete len:87 (+) Transcript_4711:1595-1855(+)